MSFSFGYLEVGKTRTLSAAEVSQHQIDQFGNSALPIYSDSLFSVVTHSDYTIFSGGQSHNKSGGFTVTRILKKDLEFPLNHPVLLSWAQASALRVRDNGLSERPDLRDYKFTLRSSDDGKIYEITKYKR